MNKIKFVFQFSLTLILGMNTLPLKAADLNFRNKISHRIIEVGELNRTGQFAKAEVLAAETVFSLYEKIKPGTIVATINTELTEVRKELITEHSESRKSSDGLIALFDMLLPLHRWNNESTDITKIITLNPADVANFPLKIQSDLNTLKLNVQKYILNNLEEIFYLKYFAMIYFRTLTLTDHPNQVTSMSTFSLMKQKTNSITFGGQQYITACVKTEYANHSKSFDRGAEVSLPGILGFILPFHLGFSETETHQYFAYSESQCEASMNEIWEKNWPLVRINLTELDNALIGWRDQAELRLQLSPDSNRFQFPTWNSPAF